MTVQRMFCHEWERIEYPLVMTVTQLLNMAQSKQWIYPSKMGGFSSSLCERLREGKGICIQNIPTTYGLKNGTNVPPFQDPFLFPLISCLKFPLRFREVFPQKEGLQWGFHNISQASTAKGGLLFCVMPLLGLFTLVQSWGVKSKDPAAQVRRREEDLRSV